MNDYGRESRYNKKGYDLSKEKDEQEFKPFYELPKEKKVDKWDKIDWSKDTTEKKKDTKWDKIDRSKDYSSEEKKIEGYKNDNIDDNMMTGGDYKEKIEDTNFYEKKINNKDDDLTYLKNFDENISNDKDDLEKDFIENVEDKLDVNNFDKDYMEGIDDEKEHLDISKDFMEVVENELKYSEVKDMASEQQKDNNIDEISEKNYKNLLNEELQEKFKEYHEQTGKYANYGRNLKKDFIDWVENTQKNPDIINTVKDIQNNQEIHNFIKDKIQNSDLSQGEIANQLKEKGLYCNHGTVRNTALELYENNHEDYKERFSTEKYAGKSRETKEAILKRLDNEVKKENPDSIYKIQKDFPEVSQIYIAQLAKESFNPEIYQKAWPKPVNVSQETKIKISDVLASEVKNETPRSLKAIAKDFPDASHNYVMDLAKKEYPDKYQEKWPAIEKIPEETKNEIINTIKEEAQKENPRTLKDIHKDFPQVGSDSIKRIARQAIPKEVHDKVWPPAFKEVSHEVREKVKKTIINEIERAEPRSIHQISKDLNVSREYVRNIAKDIVPEAQYEKIWEPAVKELSEDLRKKIINDIKTETNLNLTDIGNKHDVSRRTVENISKNQVFKDNLETHQTRFPKEINLDIGTVNHQNINAILTNAIHESPNQKYYSEPSIYPGRRKPDGLILENNNFLYDRLTNPKNGQYLSESLEMDPNNLDHIKATQVDFTNDVSDENIINKIEKYQSKDTLLTIVGTKWYPYEETKSLPDDARIKYPENIKVMSHDLFADFVGLEGDNRDLYNNVIDFNYDHDLNSLKTLYNHELSYTNTHNTEELKQDLIQSNLIKESFDEYFDFEESNNKNDKGKQTDLDHFLNR